MLARSHAVVVTVCVQLLWDRAADEDQEAMAVQEVPGIRLTPGSTVDGLVFSVQCSVFSDRRSTGGAYVRRKERC
jgi:hypothetical protein